jgi:uncharacterized protein YjbI with pentapeptide repeats
MLLVVALKLEKTAPRISVAVATETAFGMGTVGACSRSGAGAGARRAYPMADPEQLALLKSGVQPWNGWRGHNLYEKIDLTEANLAGADLNEANLSRAIMSRADLSRARLHWANLSEANLTRADLRWANLSGAHLSRASLNRAKLGETLLIDLDLGTTKGLDTSSSCAMPRSRSSISFLRILLTRKPCALALMTLSRVSLLSWTVSIT